MLVQDPPTPDSFMMQNPPWRQHPEKTTIAQVRMTAPTCRKSTIDSEGTSGLSEAEGTTQQDESWSSEGGLTESRNADGSPQDEFGLQVAAAEVNPSGKWRK